METLPPTYPEADFVAYAFAHMGIAVAKREGRIFELANGFVVEVESKDLYRLSHEGWVISPFDDIEKLCTFIERNS
ncbi:hypothetical protein [Hymenobacter terricola]|uniref:hypothetical protein n=1 Tax=Hymenobacter terricola TaxID=2819236 RepID=UPI001B30ADC1|nr:hypothetical protein [Hymenobacter terricola]